MKTTSVTSFMQGIFFHSILFFWIPAEAFAEKVLVLGALGDSISVACNAQNLGDNPALSWSTGTDNRVNSHLKRLGALLKTDVQGLNFAVSGAKLADLSGQIDNLMSHSPDYTTIEIGANDLCSWSEDDPAKVLEFGIELRKQIARIIERNPNTKILLASIPDMYGLWEYGSRRAQCQFRWDLLGICTSLLSSRTTTQERAAFIERWRAVNASIAAVADHFSQNVIFNGAVAGARISGEHVSSIDCFHPSVKGQDYLAEKAWPYMIRLMR